jgi:hypothetical protein
MEENTEINKNVEDVNKKSLGLYMTEDIKILRYALKYNKDINQKKVLYRKINDLKYLIRVFNEHSNVYGYPEILMNDDSVW